MREILGNLAIPHFLLSNNFEQSNGYNGLLFTSWIFFVIVHSYYGGALTMFFSNEATIPFKSVEDVIKGA